MPAPVQPGMLQSIVNALRGGAGMGAQQSPGPATGLQNAYRNYQEQAMTAGEQPMQLDQWLQSQQRPVSSPR